MPEVGLTVVDTAPAYGQAEAVIGELLAKIGNRDKLFLATKVMAPNDDVAAAKAMMDESFKRLRTDHIDLMQVHNLVGVDVLMPVLQEMKAKKQIKYIGITTFDDKQYPMTMDFMRKYPLDVVQVDYSIDNRNVETALLPLAQERKIAVLLNVPFGGRRGSLFKRVAGRALPEWAAEVDAKSWAQFFLKYSISHPAVTCAHPGTTDVAHLEDNMGGARGRFADAAMRKRMEEFWATVG
jgi:aryl-alcohol dehydrogenase-like predicted oxidoreductase